MNRLFLNDSSRIFSGANPFEVSDFVNRHVGSHELRMSRHHDSSASLQHRKVGALNLCRLSYGTQARIVSEGLPDIYHVQFILRGHCRYELWRDSLSLPAGHVLVINPDDPVDLTYSEDCEKFIVKIPTGMLNDACEEHRWFKPNERIKFNQVPYKFAELDSLIQLLTIVCQEAESGLATPQMLQHYNRVVSGKLMTMLKHNVCMETPAAHSVCFDRLVQYIDERIKDNLTAESLAAYSRMSLRSLYLLFERHARTTPKNYIRQKKLERVHSTLMDTTQNIHNVTAIALDYGFTHLGRFSELYKSTFGMLPSESLRRHRGGAE
ncbi:AraC family transcriptional regulator [Zoogloea sp.]|uniref:AraC family transcriptional regulator n=1 Tax=Zoogloea sp. TaxID=49181 RepID=UPI0035ADF79A